MWDLTDPNVNPTIIGFNSGLSTAGGTWNFSFNGVNNAGGNAGCGRRPERRLRRGVHGINRRGAPCGRRNLQLGLPVHLRGAARRLRQPATSAPATMSILTATGLSGQSSRQAAVTSVAAAVRVAAESTVPEPASLLLFGLGALATGHRARRAVR